MKEVKIKLCFMMSMLTFSCFAIAQSYPQNTLGSFEIKSFKLKSQYEPFKKQILNGLILFNNHSSYEPWWGASGDAPWSWESSACFSNKLLSNKDLNRSVFGEQAIESGNRKWLGKHDFYLQTANISLLYKKLSQFSKRQCTLSQIMVGKKQNKMASLLEIIPLSCKSDYLNQYRSDKDPYNWVFLNAQTDGQSTENYSDALERWRKILSCHVDTTYPSNTLLENAMAEYVSLFKRLEVVSSYDENCSVNLRVGSRNRGKILQAMSKKCPTPKEP